MSRILSIGNRLLISLFIGATLTAWAAPQPVPNEQQGLYDQGVDLYRNGDYAEATKRFKQIVQQSPESQEACYYLAISLAQLGKFKEARQAYKNVIRLAPNTDAAKLAQQGLEYLPEEHQLDAPPQFPKAAQTKPQIPDASDYVQAQLNPTAQPATPQQTAQSPLGMDSQTLQMMMMMGSMGGGGGGFNPMMLPLMQSMTRSQNGGQAADPQSAISPEMIRSMMTSQMMQNFGSFGSGKDD